MGNRGTRDKTTGKAVRAATRGAGKAARGTGKAALKSGATRKAARGAARGAGKVALKGGRQVLSTKEPTGRRFLKYGFFAIAGFAVGALISRSGEKEVGTASSSFTGGTGQHTPDPNSPAGQRGETWGSGTPLGTAGGSAASTAASGLLREDQSPAEPPFQRPEEPNRTGTERDYSDPSSGPLIGRQHESVSFDIPEQQQEVEQRIRTRIGEDPRTTMMPRVNVEVNGGVAEIRGEAPSQEAKEAAGEIAADTEGVREVRNLLLVSSQSPTRDRPSGEPDQPS